MTGINIISAVFPKNKISIGFSARIDVQLSKYFVCTDITLSAHQTLRYCQKRWPVEVDNFYLKEVLALGDFQLKSFDAAEKWFAVVVLAINYLQFQAAQVYLSTHASLSLTALSASAWWLQKLVIQMMKMPLARYLPAASLLMT
jgi:hypothetical protein